MASMLGNNFKSVVSRRNFSEVARKCLKLRDRRPAVAEQRARNADLEVKASASGFEWRTVGATVLHRYPTITKDAESWEKAMWEVQDKILDKKREILMKELNGTDSDILTDSTPTYEEIIESMPFKPAPRVTEADETNNRRSTRRRLQDSLFLIVKRNRSDKAWQFPQGKFLEEDEHMRGTAERVVDRAIGKTKKFFISNAPIGHYCYAYPSALQEKRNNFGAKVFFYRAQLLRGKVKLQTKLYTDYAWVARDELPEYFDAETARFLQFILPA